jgi:hypothetical protein
VLKRLFGIVVVLTLSSSLLAATRDEPWHRDVVAKAEAFGLWESWGKLLNEANTPT